MDLSWASLEAAHSTLRRWRKLMSEWGTSSELKIDDEVTNSLATDLDSPRAMQRLRSIEKDLSIGNQDKRAIFLYADQVLGLALDRTPEEKPLTDELKKLLHDREIARKEKNWADSDALRSELEDAGLEINDGPSGQSWSWK
jgi:cysteinyl-tRNA synthetase